MPESAWPAAPRPFRDEAFGGWFGRVAGRYGITVDELGAAANIQLNLNPDGTGWLAACAPAGRSMKRLAALCRLAPAEIEALAKFGTVRAGRLAYCYRCLVLNPQDVFSPYWKDSWLDDSRLPCYEHMSWVGFVSPVDMRRNRNLPRLLRRLERKWRDIGRVRWNRN
jgi:hypothetical protein